MKNKLFMLLSFVFMSILCVSVSVISFKSGKSDGWEIGYRHGKAVGHLCERHGGVIWPQSTWEEYVQLRETETMEIIDTISLWAYGDPFNINNHFKDYGGIHR